MAFCTLTAIVEGVEIFWGDDQYLVNPDKLSGLPTERIGKVLSWCEKYPGLGHALEVFQQLGYRYDDQFMNLNDLIMLRDVDHVDRSASSAARKWLHGPNSN